VIRALSIPVALNCGAVTSRARPAFERICTVLLALSGRFAIPCDGLLIDLRLTNEDLAAICGVTRQFANITLNGLRHRGVLVTRNLAVLTDVATMERLSPTEGSRKGSPAFRRHCGAVLYLERGLDRCVRRPRELQRKRRFHTSTAEITSRWRSTFQRRLFRDISALRATFHIAGRHVAHGGHLSATRRSSACGRSTLDRTGVFPVCVDPIR